MTDVAYSDDIKPSFPNMDEEQIHDWFVVFTKHMRDQGATVRTLKTDSNELDDGRTVYEAKYEWEYQDGNPVTVIGTDFTEIDALRNMSTEVFAKRHEV